MGKTPKKAAPGGDERNLYVRRLKATTVPSRAESSLLPERQRESESRNRPKLSGVQKRISAGSGKNLKSKLRASSKVGVNQATKQLKFPMKNPETATTDMQPKSEEAEVKLNVSIQKEDIQEENGNNRAIEVEVAINKEFVDYIVSEPTCEFQTPTKAVQEAAFVEIEVVSPEKEGISLENNVKEEEEQDENDMKLTFEPDQSPAKNGEGRSNNKQPKDNNQEEESSAVQTESELKNGINEREDRPSEVQTNNESYSVDIVGSTTSEISETPESVTQSDIQKNKGKIDDTLNNDASFVSYDSSIMLKSVQIRLNDCLKDNSTNSTNLLDANKYKDIELKISKYLTKDTSFGKTLKHISGRPGIKRDTLSLRERRLSPNDSLFVNTSTISIPQDEGTESKVLYSSVFSDSFPTNGSSLDRKRKFDADECSSMKKQRTDDDSNLLNRSTNLLRSFYKPVMKVSTPKATSYDFEHSKLDISGIKDDDNKIMAESTESTKKWCVIM